MFIWYYTTYILRYSSDPIEKADKTGSGPFVLLADSEFLGSSDGSSTLGWRYLFPRFRINCCRRMGTKK